MRPILLPLLLASLAPAVARAAPPPRPKLVVAISVDQLSLDLFRTYRSRFSGGLARLAGGHAFAGYQSHAATETCPGHSTLLTGDHPNRTGIVANSWWDRTERREVYCVGEDAESSPNPARTSSRLKVDALGDWMRRADPRAQVLSVSGKDRAAIMMAGHHPSAVYWWRDRVGFETSPGAGPSDAAVLAPAEAFNRRTFAGWSVRPPQLWPSTPPAYCAGLQRPLTAGAVTLPGRLPPAQPAGGADGEHGAAFASQLRGSAELDRLTLEFAGEQAEARRLGRGPATDLLAVSLSATDSVGHKYGAGGVEMCAHLAAVDAALGAFLQRLDGLGAPYVVVLSADHGGIDAAERLSPPGRRIDVRALRTALAAHLRERFGLDADPFRGGDDARQLTLLLPPDKAVLRPRVLAEAARWLRTRPEVVEVFTAAEAAAAVARPGKPPGRLTHAERFHLSFDPQRSGDLMVTFPERATLGVPQRPGSNVAGHGSVWDYDRRVPILFWWPGVTASNPSRALETVDIAPTLAAMVGVRPPPVDGRCVELGQRCPGQAGSTPGRSGSRR